MWRLWISLRRICGGLSVDIVLMNLTIGEEIVMSEDSFFDIFADLYDENAMLQDDGTYYYFSHNNWRYQMKMQDFEDYIKQIEYLFKQIDKQLYDAVGE